MSERNNKIYRMLDLILGIPGTIPAMVYRKVNKYPANSKISKIGIIILGAIGDTILLSGLINALYNEDNSLKIDIYTLKTNTEAARLLLNINKIYSYNISDLLLMIKTLRQEKYDVLLDSTQWARISSIISAFSGAKIIVGFKSKWQFRSLAYDIKITHSDKKHECNNFLALGQAIFPNIHSIPKIKVIHGDFTIPKPYVICHLWAAGSNTQNRQWTNEKWLQLINFLLCRQFNIVLTGDKSDSVKNNDFLISQKIYNIAGTVKLTELTGIINDSNAVISINTGIMHMAAILNVPTIGLHGPTSPLRWGAIGERAVSIIPNGAKSFLHFGFENVANDSYTCRIQVSQVIVALKQLDVI